MVVHRGRKGALGNLSDPLAVRSMLLYVARSDPYGMTPGFDMFNHRGGGWTNIRTGWNPGTAATVTVARRAAAGEQLYNNFLPSNEGAPDCFRDYGFVEAPPQRWFFHADGRRMEFSTTDDGSVVLPPEEAQPRGEFVKGGRKLLNRLADAPASSGEGSDAGDGSTNRGHLAQLYRETFTRALSVAVDMAARESREDL